MGRHLAVLQNLMPASAPELYRPMAIQGLIITLCIVAAMGCRTGQDAETQRAYQVALERMIQGHVYEMGCEALLPMAEQLLWDRGFHQISYEGDNDGLRTEWRDHDDMRQYHYEVHAHRVSARQCAVQIIYHEVAGETQNQRRDAERELELLDYIDESQANDIRSRARQQAEETTVEQR